MTDYIITSICSMRDAGTAHENHYAKQMGPFRLAVRRNAREIVRPETQILAQLQKTCRSWFLDHYFALTANIGTHTFYMIMLPVFYWFGNRNLGEDVIWILVLGVYLSGAVKDYLCLPRPLSPPVHRISMSGSAILEYGCPSTHTVNSLSFILLFPNRTWLKLWFLTTLVFGRLYTGMHGFLDVFIGLILGYIVWALRMAISVYDVGHNMTSSLVVTAVSLIAIAISPQPVDDCPCFDDSVSFLGVLIGLCWAQTLQYNLPWRDGIEWHYDKGIIAGFLRFVIGVSLVVTWRSISKRILLKVMPPIWAYFRKVGFLLPRKFYRSNYDEIPSTHRDEFIPDPSRQIQGMIKQLRKTRGRSDSVGPQSQADIHEARARGIKMEESTVVQSKKHYDVDVILRLIVYAGIPPIALNVASWTFKILKI